MTGHAHPITHITDDIVRIFTELGFDIADGPELETEWNNFDALNVPRDHPSRDMQDTFWIKKKPGVDKLGRPMGYVLRTHTSSVQVRAMDAWAKKSEMDKKLSPLAIVVPGKVFRNEATDATHEAQFYQVEGLLVGQGVTLAHLKGTLETFFTKLFGKDVSVRLRSSFFPFVEPGVEVDMRCFKCEGRGLVAPENQGATSYDTSKSSVGLVAPEQGCSLCKQTGWIEIMGAGMVHPNVLTNCGIDSKKYQGFAFGGGTDRLAMLKWGIDDIRLLYNGDLRVVNQF
jgi:phenylalanyl-tRNA synthetase alpha chain